LSQLRPVVQPTTTKPQEEWALAWPDFVQVVLELTIQAYQAMRQAGVARRDWEENTFTICLGDYLRPLAFDHDHSIRLEIRSKVHTQAMKDGTQATIEAKEMDMSLYGVWERDYLNKRFVWEAKRVGDKRINSDYSTLNSEYVNEAIYRFIRSEYATDLSDAGVLGYVLDGNVSSIVNDVNASMGRLRNNLALSLSNHIQITSPIRGFDDVYQSNHMRTDESLIQLHHLFLTFDFP
jgi:hypothetical protein